MGLSQTRKIISVIISFLTAFAAAALIVSAVAGSMLTSRQTLRKIIVTDELASQCERQLDAKYAVLEAETGIPRRVFEQVKKTYGIKKSLRRAVSNTFKGGNADLYNEELVEYFNRLCVEFLDGNNTPYDKTEVRSAAKKAAKIYSDTFGFHNADLSAKKITALKDRCARVILMSVLLIFVCLLIVSVIYSNKSKGYIYNFAGLSGGSLAAALCALLCLIFKVYNRFNLQPAVFNSAVGHSVKVFLTVTLAIGIVLCALFFLFFVLCYKRSQRREED